MKLSVSLGHDNDRLTVRNLAGTVEYISLIFARSNRDEVALPSCLLRSERYECLVFRVAASRQVEAPRDASPFLQHLNACHSSILSNALHSKACYFFVNELCFLKTRRAIQLDDPPGPFLSATALIFDY